MNEEMSGGRVALLRQLAIDCLSNYGGGFAELERIDRDLKSIIRSLNDIADPSWTKSLLRQWGQLEIIYALALADARLRLTQDEEDDVQGIVAALLTELRGYELPSADKPEAGIFGGTEIPAPTTAESRDATPQKAAADKPESQHQTGAN